MVVQEIYKALNTVLTLTYTCRPMLLINVSVCTLHNLRLHMSVSLKTITCIGFFHNE